MASLIVERRQICPEGDDAGFGEKMKINRQGNPVEIGLKRVGRGVVLKAALFIVCWGEWCLGIRTVITVAKSEKVM